MNENTARGMIDIVRQLSSSADECMATLRADNEALREQVRVLREALKQCRRLHTEALPKFNWGASALDANAIALLNEVPLEVIAALARTEPKP